MAASSRKDVEELVRSPRGDVVDFRAGAHALELGA
jgi:hypothetical protein